MNLDRTSVIAIVVFVVFMVAYDHYMKQKYPVGPVKAPPAAEGGGGSAEERASEGPVPAPPGARASLPPSAPTPSQASSQAPTVSASGSVAAKIKRWSQDQLTFTNGESRWVLEQDYGGFSSVQLQQYRRTQEGDELVDLVGSGLWLQALLVGESLGPKPWHVVQDSPGVVEFWRRASGDVIVRQTYTFPDQGYGVGFRVRFENVGAQFRSLQAYIVMEDSLPAVSDQESGVWMPALPTGHPTVALITDQGVENHDVAEACEQNAHAGEIDVSELSFVRVAGLDDYYFLRGLVSLDSAGVSIDTQGLRASYALRYRKQPPGWNCRLAVYLGQNFGQLSPGAAIDMNFDLFLGPKDYRITQSYHPELTQTIQLGWFAFLSRPMLYVLHLFYDYLGNYGLAIILLTVILKFLFFPLTRAAAISMHRSRKLQPQLTALRKRHKDDPLKLQREMMAFMKKHKMNPFKGCLPVLPQMPVFFALYRVLSTAVELRHAPFFGWIHDLSAADPYFVSPILLTAGMYLQQRIMPQVVTDELQRKVLQWMPVLFGVMMAGLPAGMVIYMLANTVISILQQFYLNKVLDKPA